MGCLHSGPKANAGDENLDDLQDESSPATQNPVLASSTSSSVLTSSNYFASSSSHIGARRTSERNKPKLRMSEDDGEPRTSSSASPRAGDISARKRMDAKTMEKAKKNREEEKRKQMKKERSQKGKDWSDPRYR